VNDQHFPPDQDAVFEEFPCGHRILVDSLGFRNFVAALKGSAYEEYEESYIDFQVTKSIEEARRKHLSGNCKGE
jgi:hypothetical protein